MYVAKEGRVVHQPLPEATEYANGVTNTRSICVSTIANGQGWETERPRASWP